MHAELHRDRSDSSSKASCSARCRTPAKTCSPPTSRRSITPRRSASSGGVPFEVRARVTSYHTDPLGPFQYGSISSIRTSGAITAGGLHLHRDHAGAV